MLCAPGRGCVFQAQTLPVGYESSTTVHERVLKLAPEAPRCCLAASSHNPSLPPAAATPCSGPPTPFPANPELSDPVPTTHTVTEVPWEQSRLQRCALSSQPLPLLERFPGCSPKQGIALGTVWAEQPPVHPQHFYPAGELSLRVVGSCHRKHPAVGTTLSRTGLSSAFSPIHPQPAPH